MKYKDVYLDLFRAITDAIVALQRAQQACEERILDDDMPFDEE